MPLILSPVPATPAAFGHARWASPRVAMAQPVWIEGDGQRHHGLRWEMRRNCSISPGQLLVVYLALCAVSLGIATGFFLSGAQPVLAFAGVEVLALGLALMAYARHAGDHETLTLAGSCLSVHQHDGPQSRHTEFRAEWLAVEPSGGQGSLVELSGQGRSLRIGRFLRPELRDVLAQELRSALRKACLAPHETDTRIESQDP